ERVRRAAHLGVGGDAGARAAQLAREHAARRCRRFREAIAEQNDVLAADRRHQDVYQYAKPKIPTANINRPETLKLPRSGCAKYRSCTPRAHACRRASPTVGTAPAAA